MGYNCIEKAQEAVTHGLGDHGNPIGAFGICLGKTLGQEFIGLIIGNFFPTAPAFYFRFKDTIRVVDPLKR